MRLSAIQIVEFFRKGLIPKDTASDRAVKEMMGAEGAPAPGDAQQGKGKQYCPKCHEVHRAETACRVAGRPQRKVE